MASNCLAFAARVLQAAHPNEDPNKAQVRGIALLAAAFACVIHSVSRRGGIWLSNFLACVKLGILLLIIVTTLVVVGGAIKDKDGNTVPNVFIENTFYETAFQPPRNLTVGADPNASLDAGTANGYAAAFLSISKPSLLDNYPATSEPADNCQSFPTTASTNATTCSARSRAPAGPFLAPRASPSLSSPFSTWSSTSATSVPLPPLSLPFPVPN